VLHAEEGCNNGEFITQMAVQKNPFQNFYETMERQRKGQIPYLDLRRTTSSNP